MTRIPIVLRLALAFGTVLLLAGCVGRTTGASDVRRQPDGSYSARLNARGSCDTRCTVFMRWRPFNQETWTNGASFEVPNPVSDVPFSRPATGLFPGATYEYQVCGKEAADDEFVCAGPDADPARTERFEAVNLRETDSVTGEVPDRFLRFDIADAESGVAPGSFFQFTSLGDRARLACLRVSGNRAVFGHGLASRQGGNPRQGYLTAVTDGGPGGQDRLSTRALAEERLATDADCDNFLFTANQGEPITSGEIVVRDLP